MRNEPPIIPSNIILPTNNQERISCVRIFSLVGLFASHRLRHTYSRSLACSLPLRSVFLSHVFILISRQSPEDIHPFRSIVQRIVPFPAVMDCVNTRKRARDEDEEELSELRYVAKVRSLDQYFTISALLNIEIETTKPTFSRRSNRPA